MSKFIEDKIKITKANIRILENSLAKKDDEKLQKKLQTEKQKLEEFKDKYPEFFI